MVVASTPLLYPDYLTAWGISIGTGMLLDVVGVLLTEKSVQFAKNDIYDARDEIKELKTISTTTLTWEAPTNHYSRESKN